MQIRKVLNKLIGILMVLAMLLGMVPITLVMAQTGPTLISVSPAEGPVVLAADETFVLTVNAYDADGDLYELEIDHSMEATLPEFSVYASAENPYGTSEDQAQFAAAGVEVTYDATEQKWTIDFGPDITGLFLENGGITFYLVLHDLAGNKWGSMSPPTSENTFAYTLTQVVLDKEFYSVGEQITVTVTDATANQDPIRPDQVIVHVTSTADNSGIDVTLTETGPNTGIFTGSFTTTTTVPAPIDVLGVKAGDVDTVIVKYGSSETTAVVDDAKPTITDVAPADEAFVTDLTDLTISATLADEGSGIDVDTATMTVDGEPVVAEVETVTEVGEIVKEASISYTPSEDLSEGLHTVTVDVSDEVGNAAETVSWSFTVDTIKPTVAVNLSPEPPYTAEGIITFTLTFSEDMDITVEPTVTFGLPTMFDTHTVDGGWSEESLTEWVGSFAIDETWVIDDDGEQTLKISGAKDEAGNEMDEDTDNTFYIDLNAPDAPMLSEPADEDIIEDTKPTFEWGAVIDGSGVTYQLQVDDDDEFLSPELDVSDIEEPSYKPEEGLDNALYYWRVRAIDGAGNEGEWSEVRTFTLNADTEDPVVTLISPNGGEVWHADSEQIISWTAGDNITDDEKIQFTLELLRGGVSDSVIATGVTVDDDNLELVDGVFSYTWTIPPKYNNNYYRIKITAEDEQGNTATDISDNDFTIVPLITHDIQLLAGWNLISLPLIPNDTSIEVLLADLVDSESVAQVVAWPYDLDLGRIVEMRWNGVQLTDITDLEDGPGYWIEMTEPGVLKFDGVPMVGPGMAPPAYNVYAGWNLIGFKSQQTTMDAQTYLGTDVSASMRMMYEYDADTGFYSQVFLTEPALKPGSGYWLAVSTNGTIYPPAN